MLEVDPSGSTRATKPALKSPTAASGSTPDGMRSSPGREPSSDRSRAPRVRLIPGPGRPRRSSAGHVLLLRLPDSAEARAVELAELSAAAFGEQKRPDVRDPTSAASVIYLFSSLAKEKEGRCAW